MGVSGERGTACALQTDELLHELRRREWTLVRWGHRERPILPAAMYQWPLATDVLILRSEDDASAYRVPAGPHDDRIWNPQMVAYQFHSSALWTLRAILTIEAPGQPGSPGVMERAATACALPEDLPRPVLVRPLSPYRR